MSYDAKFRGYQPAANWTDENPVLEQFTIGYETDTGKAKLGDGVTAWNDLGYWNPAEGNVKRYRALLTQSETEAPVATVLENTFGGEVVWTRVGVGAYRGTLAGAFTAGKTFFPKIGMFYQNDDLSGLCVLWQSVWNNNTVAITTGTGAETKDDSLMSDLPIEIIVYP